MSNSLPPFYCDLLSAWRTINGHVDLLSGNLVVSGGLSADSLSCKYCYSCLLSHLASTPHCVLNFNRVLVIYIRLKHGISCLFYLLTVLSLIYLGKSLMGSYIPVRGFPPLVTF